MSAWFSRSCQALSHFCAEALHDVPATSFRWTNRRGSNPRLKCRILAPYPSGLRLDSPRDVRDRWYRTLLGHHMPHASCVSLESATAPSFATRGERPSHRSLCLPALGYPGLAPIDYRLSVCCRAFGMNRSGCRPLRCTAWFPGPRVCTRAPDLAHYTVRFRTSSLAPTGFDPGIGSTPDWPGPNAACVE